MPRAQPQRLHPRDDHRSIGATTRWSELERLMLVSRAAPLLSFQEVRDIAHGKPLHKIKAYEERFRQVYAAVTAELVEQATADAHPEGGEGVEVPHLHKLQQRNVRACITEWLPRLLRDGHVHDRPPHQPGYRLQRNMPVLTGIRELLLAGWTDSIGQKCLFRSLHDLQNRKPGEFAALKAELHGVKTLRGIWSQLTSAFPAMRKMTVRAKKVRDGAPVQVWAHHAGHAGPPLLHPSPSPADP